MSPTTHELDELVARAASLDAAAAWGEPDAAAARAVVVSRVLAARRQLVLTGYRPLPAPDGVVAFARLDDTASPGWSRSCRGPWPTRSPAPSSCRPARGARSSSTTARGVEGTLDVAEALAAVPGRRARQALSPEREAGPMGETALVVLVSEAEPLVADHRLRHDPPAAAGVPAHVTVLYPFRPVVDDGVAAVVAEIAAGVPAFDVTFATLGRFPGEVVHLVPDPDEPFRRLTAATAAAFPDCPPYGGTIPDPIPHLTVADGVDMTTAAALEDAVRPGLPVASRVERLTLIVQDETGRWVVGRHWPLG